MKTNKVILKVKAALLLACTIVLQANLLAAHHRSTTLYAKDFDGGKKPSRKERPFKNQNVVKIIPDAFKKTMHVVARSGNKKDIDFLVFDVDGNMVLNYKMKAGEHRTISELKKGAYLYHVFADDEYLTTGKIVFK